SGGAGQVALAGDRAVQLDLHAELALATDLVDLEAKLDHRRMPPYDLFDAARQQVDAAHQEALAQSAAHAALGPRRTPAAGTRAAADLGQVASAVADQRRPALGAAGDHQFAQLAVVDRPIAVGLDQLD